MSIVLDTLSLWAIFVSMFYIFAPHSVHQQFSPDWLVARFIGARGFPHWVHVSYGLLILGYALLNLNLRSGYEMI